MKVVHSQFPGLCQAWKCVQGSGVFATGRILHIMLLHFPQRLCAESRATPGSNLPPQNLPAHVDLDSYSQETHATLQLQPMTFLLPSLGFPTSVLWSPNLKCFHLTFATCKYPALVMKTWFCKLPWKNKKERQERNTKWCIISRTDCRPSCFKEKVFAAGRSSWSPWR